MCQAKVLDFLKYKVHDEKHSITIQVRTLLSQYIIIFVLPFMFCTVLKYNQASRGVQGLQARVAQRAATHKTWRQMKGMDRVMFELTHPGNKPFMIGFAVTTGTFLYMYFASLGSPALEAESQYWQRFHAKKDAHH